MDVKVIVYDERDVCDLKVGKNFMREQAKKYAAEGIRAIQLLRSEVVSNPTIVENLTRYAKGDDTRQSIAARKCTVRAVQWEVAKEFYAANHPQGSTAYMNDTLGLWHDGALVAAMSFSAHGDRRGAASNSLQGVSLTRFATSVRVPGGAGKLLSAWRKENPTAVVVSYSDNRLFSGEMYAKLGFVVTKEVPADYMVYNPFTKELRHKSAFQRKRLERWRVELGRDDIPAYDHLTDPRTEFQMEDALGLLRIYQAGMLRWELPALTPVASATPKAQDYYVYVHRKATTGEIFYVGKGKGGRAWDAKVGRNPHWHRTVAKHGLRVELVQTGMQEWWAFELEQELIACIGRRDTGSGPLVNMTDGGEGESGRVMQESTRKLQSTIKTGKVPSVETRKRMAAAQKGRKHSADTKKKMSASGRKRSADTFGFRPKVAVVKGDSIIFEGSVVAEQWLRANGYPTADRSNLVKCCRGKIKASCGSVWRYATPEETAALKEKGAAWAPFSALRSVA